MKEQDDQQRSRGQLRWADMASDEEDQYWSVDNRRGHSSSGRSGRGLRLSDVLPYSTPEDLLMTLRIRKPVFMPLGLSCSVSTDSTGTYLVVTSICFDSVVSRWNRHVRAKIDVGCRIYSINNIANDPLRMQQEIFTAGNLRMEVSQDCKIHEPFNGNPKLIGRRIITLHNPMWFQFTITLRRVPEMPFGLLMRPSVLSNGCCMLMAVTTLRHGLVFHWNSRCMMPDWQSRAILKGDFFADVNGINGDIFSMLSECSSKLVLHITVWRLFMDISLEGCSASR